jgi:hypothetical protein
MIEYTERRDGEFLYACLTLDDGCYMEVPIHNVDAADVQARLQRETERHVEFMQMLSLNA